MGRIIQGAEISNYKTIGISLGQSKRPNIEGKMSKYIVLTVKNRKSIASKARRITLFDEDVPQAMECLKAFISNTPNDRGEYPVNMQAFKADPSAMDEWGGLLEFPGGMVVQYPLSKGLCYQNDVDGNPVFVKGTQERVIKDRISVFVQVDFASENDKGGLDYTYIDGFDPYTRGSRIEQNLYRVPVNSYATAETEDDETPISVPPTQAPQQAPAQTQAPAPTQAPQQAPLF